MENWVPRGDCLKNVTGEGREGKEEATLSSPRLHHHLVDVAPEPVLARLDGLDDGVAGGMEVLRRVLVLRGIAAADLAAGETQPQMDPGVAHLQALFAAPG